MKLTDSRRWTGRFLTALAILVLVFSSGLNQSALAERQDCHASSLDKSDVTDSNRYWVEPPVLQADDGTSDFTVNLTAKLVKKTVDTLFDNCNLYSYEFSCGDNCTKITDERWNDNIPVGPTIKVKPGDTLRVNLTNELMDKTNLHTHGLHISPKENSDNVLLEINNSQTQGYEYVIDDNHYPGTFWYHPHVHGTTATQVEDGMAGALIVEDPVQDEPDNLFEDEPDDLNWVNKAEDRIFVFQQIPMFKGYKSGPDAQPDEEKDFEVTINGVRNPEITMDLGGLERWRFIHAGEDESIALDFNSLISANYEFRLIALDGITLEYPRNLQELQLYPGYRADVIVKAPTQSQPQDKSSLTNNRQKVVRLFRKYNPYLRASIPGQEEDDEDLVTVKLSGEDSDHKKIKLPENDNDVVLRDPKEQGLLHDIEEENIGDIISEMTNTIEDPREVEFNIFKPETNFHIFKEEEAETNFHINGKQYPDPQDVGKFCLKRGDAEYWKLTSAASSHPFHIHVNAFQVVKPGDSGTEIGDWHDTIIVNDRVPVIIKTRYDDFDGPFVLHCHILHHEDGGMMSLVEITDNGENCNTTPPALAKIDK